MIKSEHLKWKKKPECTECGQEFDKPYLWCRKCNSLVSVPFIEGPPASEIRLHSMWSLKPFFPSFKSPISLFEGATPILKLKNIPKLEKLNVKLEFRNPTNSFRDRASSLIISDAVEKNFKSIINASTGSFSISISAYSAKASIQSISVFFKNQNIELSKIEQLKVYNSEIRKSGETFKEAKLFASQIAKQKQGYFPIPNNNLLTIEGQKTIGLEIALQMKNIESIIVPRGSGSLILSIYKGLKDAQASNWIDNLPVIYSVSLKESYVSHLVESLEIEEPPLYEKITDILKETGGKEFKIDPNVMVEDALILSKKEGMFVEPASASVISAARKLVDNYDINLDLTIAILTGSGINALNIFASQMRDIKKVVWGLSPSSTSKFEILNIIDQNKANHGYAIWVSMGKSRSIQSTYQHLSELEKKGLISYRVAEKNKKIYSLTKKGHSTLENMRDLVDLA
ncbi:MAG: pyridoxal-phosphate dependent enzyme [Promethearchaeota archaeon]